MTEVDALREFLERRDDVRLAYVFGSVASGQARPTSRSATKASKSTSLSTQVTGRFADLEELLPDHVRFDRHGGALAPNARAMTESPDPARAWLSPAETYLATVVCAHLFVRGGNSYFGHSQSLKPLEYP